jgi:hypothetical protein
VISQAVSFWAKLHLSIFRSSEFRIEADRDEEGAQNIAPQSTGRNRPKGDAHQNRVLRRSFEQGGRWHCATKRFYEKIIERTLESLLIFAMRCPIRGSALVAKFKQITKVSDRLCHIRLFVPDFRIGKLFPPMLAKQLLPPWLVQQEVGQDASVRPNR